ncbi:phosphatase PAP2 family protein [Mobiluncus porci]|uniref:phosphatase PAP2 family protein n=1 Tax=Mobiluncus porci TaxID=2652278 RepID=UPI0030B8EC04
MSESAARADNPRNSGRPEAWLTRNRLWRLVISAVFALAAVAGTHLALSTVHGQNFDGITRFAVSRGKRLLLGADAAVLDTISMGALIALTGIVLIVAALRRRAPLGLRVLILVAGANLTTQALKHLIIHRPNLGVDYEGLANSLPSGHATVAMTAAIGIVMVAPVRARSVATFIGWVTASFVGIAVMLNEWHRLSDVLVAFLIAGIWGVLLAPREATVRRFGRFHRVTLLASLLATVLGAGAGAVAWVRTPLKPLNEATLVDVAHTGLGAILAFASIALVLGLAGVILALINTQAREH